MEADVCCSIPPKPNNIKEKNSNTPRNDRQGWIGTVISTLSLTQVPLASFHFHSSIPPGSDMTVFCGTDLVFLIAGQLHTYPTVHETQGTRFRALNVAVRSRCENWLLPSISCLDAHLMPSKADKTNPLTLLEKSAVPWLTSRKWPSWSFDSVIAAQYLQEIVSLFPSIQQAFIQLSS